MKKHKIIETERMSVNIKLIRRINFLVRVIVTLLTYI